MFEDDLEDDPLVFFHGTALSNLEGIAAEGFRIPDKSANTGLASVSFAKKSGAALAHVLRRREDQPGVYCIIAVRYQTIERAGIKENVSDIHDYTLEPPPELVGYCKVPDEVKYVWNE